MWISLNSINMLAYQIPWRKALALHDIQWIRLSEIPEKDRVFLLVAGLLGIPKSITEVSEWRNSISIVDYMSSCFI
jgi:hypothetical protein